MFFSGKTNHKLFQNEKTKSVLFFFIFYIFFPFTGNSQESNKVLELPLFFTETNPESPVGIFSLDFPFYFPTNTQPGHKFSFGYSMGNVWHPKSWYYYPHNMTPEQSRITSRLFFVDRPTYFTHENIKTTVRSYQADGVLQHFRFTSANRWRNKHNLLINMNIHLLSSGKSFVNYLVSDEFIENFHSTFAVEDNFGRKLYPFNRALIEYKDDDGNNLRINNGNLFCGVLDAHYYYELYQKAKPKSHFYSQAAFHLSVPLNKFHQYVIPGFSLGVRNDFEIGKRSALSLAFDGGFTFQKLLKMSSSVNVIDKNSRAQGSLYTGYHLAGKNRTFTFGFLNQYQDPLLKGGRLDWEQLGYSNIGVRYLQEGDFWEGEYVKQEFWLTKLASASLYSFSIKSYIIFGFHKHHRSLNIYIGEDLIAFNNSPDFQVGFQYSFSLSGNKK